MFLQLLFILLISSYISGEAVLPSIGFKRYYRTNKAADSSISSRGNSESKIGKFSTVKSYDDRKLERQIR